MSLYLIFALIVMIILMWVRFYKDDVDVMEFVLHSFATVMVLFAFCEYSNSPNAIDVYRGKTTLEIIYRDSIPMDSVVVFKERR